MRIYKPGIIDRVEEKDCTVGAAKPVFKPRGVLSLQSALDLLI